MDLAEMLREMQTNKKSTPAISHVGQIARLREFKERFDAPNPFATGDIVTPRADSAVKGVGTPHIVVEVGSIGRAMTSEPGSNSYGSDRRRRLGPVPRRPLPRLSRPRQRAGGEVLRLVQTRLVPELRAAAMEATS